MKFKLAMIAPILMLGSMSLHAADNELSPEQKQDGWKLLFNGENFDGWSNFKSEDVRPGWKVIDGKLVCVDPSDAGDLCTTEKFSWFELELEYLMTETSNSGVIYHVTEKGDLVWQTGPEVQLQANSDGPNSHQCGWLYELYKPIEDPETGKPIDATKPIGEWGHIRIVVSPEKCEHYVNGVKYLEYVLGSDDFNQRVAASKFGSMPDFAKSNEGFIALQGDHGKVSFKNIKIKELKEHQESDAKK